MACKMAEELDFAQCSFGKNRFLKDVMNLSVTMVECLLDGDILTRHLILRCRNDAIGSLTQLPQKSISRC